MAVNYGSIWEDPETKFTQDLHAPRGAKSLKIGSNLKPGSNRHPQ